MAEEKTNSLLVQRDRGQNDSTEWNSTCCVINTQKNLFCASSTRSGDPTELHQDVEYLGSSGWCSCLLSPPSIRESPISPVVIAATAIFHRPRPTCGQCYGRACGSSCRAALLACMKGSEKSAQCSEGAVLTVTSRSFTIGSLEVAETLDVANSEGKMTSR